MQLFAEIFSSVALEVIYNSAPELPALLGEQSLDEPGCINYLLLHDKLFQNLVA